MEERETENLQGNERERSLGWVDLGWTLGGLFLVFVLVGLGTLWISLYSPNEKVLMYLNGFLTQFAFAFLILLIQKFRHWEWQDLGWHPVGLHIFWRRVLGLYFLTWAINIIYVLILYWNNLTPPTTDVYTKLFAATDWWMFVLNIILAVILAPVIEETLFRGLVYGSLRIYGGKWVAAAISAAIFSGLHLQTYGFFSRFVLGLALAYLYERYRSLYPSIALHAFNNLIATLLMLAVG